MFRGSESTGLGLSLESRVTCFKSHDAGPEYCLHGDRALLTHEAQEAFDLRSKKFCCTWEVEDGFQCCAIPRGTLQLSASSICELLSCQYFRQAKRTWINQEDSCRARNMVYM